MMIMMFTLMICVFYSLTVRATGCSSQSLSSYNESSFSGGEFSSGIQLLIPSWNFTCQGTITSWTAHVTGNTSITDLFEFQIFEPDSVEDGVYHAVYGNLYRGANAQDSMITVPVENVQNTFIPIRPGYIVGVYIPPSVANSLSLLYEDAGDTDVYYWENIENRTCDFSLCSGKVMRNINPLIGWTFLETSLTNIETKLGVLKQNTKYCIEVQVSDCLDPTAQPSSSSSSISLITSTQDSNSLSITASLSPTSTPNSSSFLTPALTAGLIIVFFLFLVVLILAYSICIYCFLGCKEKTNMLISQPLEIKWNGQNMQIDDTPDEHMTNDENHVSGEHLTDDDDDDDDDYDDYEDDDDDDYI